MNLTLANAIISGIACLVTVFIIAQWWYDSRGAWYGNPAGRSVMLLLFAVALIYGRSSVIAFMPGTQGTPLTSALTQLLALSAIVWIGIVRRRMHLRATKKKADK